MGFILDGLDTEAYDRTYSDSALVARITRYFRPHMRQLGLVALALTLNSLAATAGPIIIARALDIIKQNATTQVILLLAAGILILGATGWVFNYIQQLCSAQVVGDVVLKLREDVFGATMRHDLSFFDAHPSGKIVSRITSDTQDFSDVVSLITNLFSQILIVIFVSIWLLGINAPLVFMLWALTPIVVWIALSFRRLAREVTRRARRVTAKINAQIQESVSGIMVAKSFRQEGAIYDTFSANNRQAYAVGLRRGLTLNTIFPILNMTNGAATGLLVYFGGLATRTGGLSPGNWYLFIQAVAAWTWPIINIASFWSQFQDGLSAAERIFALMDAEPKVVQAANEAVPQLDGQIEFRHLQLAYTASEVVLPDFSLHVQPRETIALVGHTGAGKSSVGRLIARFYEFQGGELLIDGRDIRRLELAQYRRHIGIVPQDPFLFSGTVRDNIRYGQPDATDEQVQEAAMGIGRGDWLADLARRAGHRRRRARRQPFDGPTPARGAGTRAVQRPGDLHPGRGHGQRQPLHGSSNPGRAGDDHARPHGDRDRPSAIDGQARQPHHRVEAGANHRRRHARFAAGRGRALLRAVQRLLPPPGAGLQAVGVVQKQGALSVRPRRMLRWRPTAVLVTSSTRALHCRQHDRRRY